MELQENWSRFAGYEWVIFREVLLNAQDCYERENLPWYVAEKNHSMVVDFYDFLKYFIPSVAVVRTVFDRISACRRKNIMQNINFSPTKMYLGIKSIELTVNFGMNRFEVPEILIGEFWDLCIEDRAKQVSDLIILDLVRMFKHIWE
jgi:hypothetical protein